MSISRDTLQHVRNGVCAVGYLKTPVAEYLKDPHAPAFKIIGTGFVAKPGFVITNRHVILRLNQAAERDGVTAERFFLQFNYPGPSGVEVQQKFLKFQKTGVILTEVLDIGMIGYKPSSNPEFACVQPLVFADELDIAVGQPVAALGFAFGIDHLSRDEGGQARLYRLGPILQQGYVSAIAPFDQGTLVERVLLDLRTSGGMSGSPVFDPQTGTVIGVHDAGRDATTAFAVPLDKRIVDTLADVHQNSEENKPYPVELNFVRRRLKP